MARNTLKLDTSELEQFLKKIEEMGGNVERVTEKILVETAQRIAQDTLTALAKPNLPAQGRYSSPQEKTRQSVVQDATATWDGSVVWAPVGFRFSMPGAGGFLISGTPRMAPDLELRKMYKQKKYMNDLQKQMWETAWEEYMRVM